MAEPVTATAPTQNAPPTPSSAPNTATPHTATQPNSAAPTPTALTPSKPAPATSTPAASTNTAPTATQHNVPPSTSPPHNAGPPTASPPTATAAPPTAIDKLKRFRFNDAADLLLLKAVSSTKCHLAPWGQKGSLSEEAHGLLMRAAPPLLFTGRDKTSQKTMEDRFKAIINKRSEAVRINGAASGIAEEYGENETLADDIILEMDEKTEQDRAEKNQKNGKEEPLVRAGEDVRNRALSRQMQSEDERGSSSDTPPASTSRLSSRRAVDEEGESINNELVADIKKRRINDDNRLAMEEERAALVRERVNLAAKQFQETQETKSDVEIEERKQAMEERKKMIDVLGMLAQKLSRECRITKCDRRPKMVG